MKASELIERLNQLIATHGDLPVTGSVWEGPVADIWPLNAKAEATTESRTDQQANEFWLSS